MPAGGIAEREHRGPSPPAGELEAELREIERRCEASRRRSLERRMAPPARRKQLLPRPRQRWRPGRWSFAVVGFAALFAAIALTTKPKPEPTLRDAVPAQDAAHPGAPAAAVKEPPRLDRVRRAEIRERVESAAAYAARRGGLVSFAFIDPTGQLRGLGLDRRYVSASVVKALLLAAELRRLNRASLPLDSATRDLLTRMVTWSDNAAADTIYGRLGDEGLRAVAARAGMSRFDVHGHWTTAQVTARDLAAFMLALDRLLPQRHLGFARNLLAEVVPAQRWGIPDGAARDYEVTFKGGWRATELGQLTHQAALLERGDERAALVVLTDAQPTQAHAIETIEGIARRLVGQPLARAP